MKRRKILFFVILHISLPCISLAAINGQASFWALFNHEDRVGLRYMPDIKLSRMLKEERSLDLDISLNAYADAPFDSLSDIAENAELKLYRSWLRYSAPRYEIRFGLQKINFGPAKVLRSLMWFDQLDVRDPLELTDGVYAFLARYYFLNNANVWFWGLYGNDELKGLETVKTDKENPEWGARGQIPVPEGEMAVTFHQRRLDRKDWNSIMSDTMTDGLENRLALDGNFDIGIGLWFESSVSQTKINSDKNRWLKFLTLGSDYTFPPGIHVLGEHFIRTTGPKISETDRVSNLSALSLDYNLGIVDSMNLIGYFDWDQNTLYSFIGWRRTYDNWLIDILAFSGKEDTAGAFSGKGIQIMFTYNH